MTKKYNVSIEQPMCVTVEIEAEDIDQALEIAKEKWNNEEIIMTADDYGTEPQIMAQSEDGSETTDWNDF